jgi:DNA polymerase III epsilon subunit-like protein
MSLAEQTVLLLDIQATAAAPADGELLEIGWWPYLCEELYPIEGYDGSMHTRLVQHASIDLPPHIGRLTGLSEADLRTGYQLADIYEELLHDAGQVAAAQTDGARICPVVVHYARFEAPYLEQLRALAPGCGGVDLDLICTHEIVRRLVPGLPRKGLRAVAGYFGHDTAPQRRCSHHLRATAAIWTALAPRLAAGCQITTLGDLRAWMIKTPVPSKTKRSFQVPAESLARAPRRPGVYRLFSQNGNCLYVGKAKYLNQRLRTYFQPRRRHAEHILEMLSRAADLKISPTRTALEAALLENDLIKALAPPYNIALRSDGAGLEFRSRDFQCHAYRWEPQHPFGPLPVGEFSALSTLARILGSADTLCTAVDTAELADLWRAYSDTAWRGLEAADLKAGLQLFAKTHRDMLGGLPPVVALLAIGRRLWIDRHLAPALDPQCTPDPTPELADGGDKAATASLCHPEQVCRRLEHAVCHLAALLRRSRWMALLGNATLTWSSPHSDTERCLVFRKGRVVARGDHRPPTTARPRRRSTHHLRWRPADRVTYDRLRVATTELRRLVQEKRAMTIRLDASGNDLHRGQVARRLRWF